MATNFVQCQQNLQQYQPNQEFKDVIHFFSSNWYVLFNNNLDSFLKDQEFPSIHGHKCWSVPKKLATLSPQSVIQRRDWFSGPNCCDQQQHAVRCSGSKQSLDT